VLARILLGTDLHKRARDISTIEGYVECTTAVQMDLMKTCTELGVTHFFHVGDWYDKGYTVDIAASLTDYDLDIKMSELLNGNFYGVIGNHLRLGMDSNPELHLIQPHDTYKSRRATSRQHQIIKTPDILRIGDVQISFMHHKKDVKDAMQYRPYREEWAKYHIALFHTESVVPSAQLAGTNYAYHALPSAKLARVLDGVDLAIVGHIHKPLGQFVVGNTTMIVPGSLTNTDAGEAERHTMVNLPVIEINDDSTVAVSYRPFNLKTNMLTFKKKNIEKSQERLKSLRGKAVADLHDPEEIVTLLSNPETTYTSLNAYMQAQGYTDMDKKLIRQVLHDPLDIEKLISIYKNEVEEM